MKEVFNLLVLNLEKIGVGIILFLCSYLANIILGAWKNISLNGENFNWNLILQSIVKFCVLGIGVGLLSIVLSIIPMYLTYIGIEIGAETMDTVDSMVIISSFATATIKYIKEAILKVKDILGN